MPKILIVDDDARLLSFLSDWLEHQRFTVETELTAEKARERLLAFTYDVILLDWGLPDTSGVEICKWFRSRGGKTPVIMLTGKNQIDDKETGFDAGADDYLTKPFNVRELNARLNALLRRGGMVEPSRIIKLAGITLDPLAHSVSVGEQPLNLTPKEFEVLEFFLRHPNQVFAPEALLQRLWKDGCDLSPDTVRVVIKGLRQKLEKQGIREIIKNVHGLGYKLVTDQTQAV